MVDPYNLERYVSAQEHSYNDAISELLDGQKQSHWMWFVFPQIKGLGSSDLAQRYAISGAGEAAAYVAHPILGSRLIKCCNLILDIDDRSAQDIFGGIDAMKLRSSMTLFSRAVGNPTFSKVLAKYFAGKEDLVTLEVLRGVHV